MDEDWDGEIAGTSAPKFQNLEAYKFYSDNRNSKEANADNGSASGFRGGSDFSRGRGRGDRGFRGGSQRSERSERTFSRQGEEKTISVESQYVGRIIGKGGSKIQDLQEMSGARIKVHRDSDGNGFTSISISGSDEQRQKAKEMILELTSDNRKGVRNGTSNGQSSPAKCVALPRPKINWSELSKHTEEYNRRRFANLPPMQKNFYIECPEVANMHSETVKQIRAENFNITVKSLAKEKVTAIPNPVTTFEQAFEHYPDILDTVYQQKFSQPTPIQCQAWPVLLQGLDLIGIAQTGTGKTVAFLLPAFIHIDGQPVPREERVGPSVLVLSPTRELALQIEEEVKKFSYKGIRSICVYGGGDRREQIDKCGLGVEIIVATPGRLNDLVMNGFVNVKSVTYLVLDEADRMLDMGFEPEIRKILVDIRPDRQTVMTSATWPPDVQRIGNSYLTDPIQVFVGSLDLAAVHSVTQRVEIVSEDDKRDMLYEFIENMEPEDKVIIFVGRKLTVLHLDNLLFYDYRADDISSDLTLREINCQCIHGDREQYDREQALDDIKTSRTRILVATDVASRGLDVKDLTHVLNYDMPRNIEEYVHRVGRTGRAGRTGTSVTFITREDWGKAKDLIDILVEANQEVPQELVDMADRFMIHKEKKDAGRGYGGRGGGRRGGWDFSGGYGGGGGRGRRNDGVRICFGIP